MKKKLIVLQEGNKDCGAASLLSVIRYYGGDISLDRLIELTKTNKEGTNFYNISETARALGLATRCYAVDDVNKLRELPLPILVQLNNKGNNHFVVLYKITEDKVVVMDPSSGRRVVDLFDFSSTWTSNIMIFEKIKDLTIYKNNKLLNKSIIRCLLSNKNIIISTFILSLIFTLLSLLISLYSQIIFDKVLDSTMNNLVIITLIFSILIVLNNITSFTRNYLIVYLNQKLDVTIILSTFSKIVMLPYHYYKNKTTGEILSRINDLSYLKNFITNFIITLVLDLLLFTVSIIVIYIINKKILFLYLLIIILYMIIVLIFNPIIRKATILNQENNARLNNNIVEALTSFETIKGLNIEDTIIFKFSKIYSKSLNTLYYSEKISNTLIFIKGLIEEIGILFCSFICFREINNGNLSIGSYTSITLLSGYLINPSKNIINSLNNYHYVRSSIKRINNLLDIEEDNIYDNNKLKVNGNISVKLLSYTFNNRNYIFNNINFYIKDKDKVLVLGPSGSGKSTILKLIYKYYKVDRDKIYINNYDINDYSMKDIRQNVTYVSQQELLFTDTIRNNIILGRRVEEEYFLNISKITYVEDIVQNSILGYDYMLEENGINLSGGQRQRIILARSLLKNSSIIMIDEGFSQIDSLLERKILENIFSYFSDKTIIVISHRQDNKDLYNRILQFNNNQVINLEKRKRQCI